MKTLEICKFSGSKIAETEFHFNDMYLIITFIDGYRMRYDAVSEMAYENLKRSSNVDDEFIHSIRKNYKGYVVN